MMPLRILHARTVRGAGGGPDKTILKSCEHLARAGHAAAAFYVLDARGDTATLPAAAERAGARMHVVLEKGPVSLATVRAFRRILAAETPDIVHTHDYKSNALAWLCRRRFGYRVIATAHGYNRTTLREVFYYALERRLFRRADAVIVPSRDLQGQLRGAGVPTRLLHVIPNGDRYGRVDPPGAAAAGGPNQAALPGPSQRGEGPGKPAAGDGGA